MTPSATGAAVVVAGIGNELRSDDGVGPAVARRLAHDLASHGHPAHAEVHALAEPLDLLDVWRGCAVSVVIDATCTGAPPGSLRVLELCGPDALAPPAGLPSTHALGVAGVLALARALGRAPARVVLVAIEGATFEAGEGLSPAVAAAVDDAVGRVLAVSREASTCA